MHKMRLLKPWPVEILFLGIALLPGALFAQRNETSTLFQYENLKVNSDFINSKDIRYTKYGQPYNDFFSRVTGLDLAYDVRNKKDFWGIAANSYHGAILYFDSSNKPKVFAYDGWNRRSALERGNIRVLTTNDGKIYAFAESVDGHVYFWDRKRESYAPEGKIEKEFRFLADFTKDKQGNLYFLELNHRHYLYRYSPSAKAFFYFSNGSDKVDLSAFYNPEWGRPTSIAANENGLYISYLNGFILRYSLLGVPERYYWIDRGNLRLSSDSKSRGGIKTSLVALALDPGGSLYAADTTAGFIHVFTKDLEYLYSWRDADPSRKIDFEFRDFVFSPLSYNCFVVHDWGFYSYKKQGFPSLIQQLQP